MNFFALILFGLIATSFGDDSSFSKTESSYLYDADSNEESIEERIISGDAVVDLKEFNYQIGLISKIEVEWIIYLEYCGGVLIHPEVVLTAAHCVYDVKYVGVFYATLIRPKDPRSANMIVEPQNIVCHKNYTRWPIPLYDIAILNLPQKIVLNDYVNTIPLASYKWTNCDGQGVASGWGQIDDQETYPSHLQSVTLNTLKFEKCLLEVYYFTAEMLIEKQQLCFSGNEGIFAVGACHGDSGGPYVQKDANGKPYLCGLTSFGPRGICTIGDSSVYTSVAYFNDNNWICDNSDRKVGCDSQNGINQDSNNGNFDSGSDSSNDYGYYYYSNYP